jgi:hypothetical protein
MITIERCEICGERRPRSKMKREDTGNGLVYLCRTCVPVRQRKPKPADRQSALPFGEASS